MKARLVHRGMKWPYLYIGTTAMPGISWADIGFRWSGS